MITVWDKFFSVVWGLLLSILVQIDLLQIFDSLQKVGCCFFSTMMATFKNHSVFQSSEIFYASSARKIK